MTKTKNIVKNHVRFKGEFKKEIKDEFPGRDLAEFIAEQLRQKEIVVSSVDYEEIWFTINVISGSIVSVSRLVSFVIVVLVASK